MSVIIDDKKVSQTAKKVVYRRYGKYLYGRRKKIVKRVFADAKEKYSTLCALSSPDQGKQVRLIFPP